MESQCQALGEAFDTNTSVFSDSLKMLESMSAVHQAVWNDYMTNGEFRFAINAGPHSPGRPDWHAYMQNYWLCMLMADFADWLMHLNPQKESGRLILPNQEETETVVFGG